ncbi:MAG TPA: branched-chain amino acid transaminase [Candidatus Acidoferrales bacterium]|nr:branched-chain amino acid transaminase [Candidatus Acidoferrales bacterium]
MGFKNVPWVWMNGSIVPWKDATLHVSAHALHYGSGVFEGIRCYETEDGPCIFRLREHLERLLASARFYEIEIPYSLEQLEKAICELISRNALSSCYIRPICFRGSHDLRIHPGNCPVEVAILVWPWGRYLASPGSPGVRICVSPWKKFHPQMMPTTAKACGQYINSVLAGQDAARRGFDEALLLNMEGNIAEGAGENIFVVRNGRIFTNEAQDSILLGVTRDSVIQIARDLGFSLETRSLALEELLSADEAFFTGTATEVAAIREVDGKRIGAVAPGPVTKRIQDVFARVISGRELKYSRWLHSLRNGEPRSI